VGISLRGRRSARRGTPRNKVHSELRLAKKDYFYDKIKLSAPSNDVWEKLVIN
jgi:hypothetical protein